MPDYGRSMIVRILEESLFALRRPSAALRSKYTLKNPIVKPRCLSNKQRYSQPRHTQQFVLCEDLQSLTFGSITNSEDLLPNSENNKVGMVKRALIKFVVDAVSRACLRLKD